MGNEPNDTANQAEKEQLAEMERRAAEDRRLNAAISSHVKRENKALRDELAQLRALLQQRPDAAPNGGGVSEAAKLAEENAQLRRQAAEEKQARVREQSSRVLLQQLEQRGVRGARAESLIALWRERGLLVDGDEGARLSVSRPRGEKKEIAQVDHDDLSLAVADWAATDAAKEFLPAPGWNRQRPPTPSNVRPPRTPRTARDARDLDGQLRDAADQLSPRQRATLQSPSRAEPEMRKTLEDLERRGLDPMKVL